MCSLRDGMGYESRFTLLGFVEKQHVDGYKTRQDHIPTNQRPSSRLNCGTPTPTTPQSKAITYGLLRHSLCPHSSVPDALALAFPVFECKTYEGREK